MCGIVGLVDNSLPFAARTVHRMISAQSHRGPDGAGIATWNPISKWKTQHTRSIDELPEPLDGFFDCVLGHNLLAIQDTGDAARQPMIHLDSGIVFNGEIYNFVELRCELERQGEEFVSHTDTEVLLKLWKREGVRCLSRLRGMFAFLIYDSQNRVLWAARDPFGIKPLYYSSTATGTVFSSEIRAIHASQLVVRAIDKQAALACVAAGVNNFGCNTLYRSVQELPPGCVARITDKDVYVQRYYTLPEAPGDLYDDNAILGLRAGVAESVNIHLRSVRKTATCLSGGLDSSIVLSLVSQSAIGSQRESVSAYTIDSGSAADSEVALASSVARKLGIRHTAASCTDTISVKDVFEMIVACETPNHKIGPINQFLLLREIAADGVSVVLDGQGGDELLSGYPWYWSVLVKELDRRNKNVDLLQKLRSKRITLDANAIRWYDVGFHDLNLWVKELMGGESFLGVDASTVSSLPETLEYLKGGGDWQSFRQREYMQAELQYLLRQEDRIGMWFGLECRVPFVDRILVDYAGHLDPALLIRDGYLKYPFRVMAPEIPEHVRWSTFKRGYWETSITRYPWLFELTRQLVLDSPVLNEIFPAIGTFSPRLHFDQVWRLLQVAVLELCSVRSDIDLLIGSLAQRNCLPSDTLLARTAIDRLNT